MTDSDDTDSDDTDSDDTDSDDTDDSTVLVGEDFSDAVLVDHHWEGSRFERCDFTDADLHGMHTRNCVFVECVFTGADLGESEHRSTAFRSCRFDRTVFTKGSRGWGLPSRAGMSVDELQGGGGRRSGAALTDDNAADRHARPAQQDHAPSARAPSPNWTTAVCWVRSSPTAVCGRGRFGRRT